MLDAIEKRFPGRPKGTGRHQSKDAALLPLIADRKLAEGQRSLSSIIGDLIDTERDSGGVRRLQRGFRANRDSLTADAVKRRQERQIKTFNEKLVAFSKDFSSVADSLSQKFELWSKTQEAKMWIDFCRRLKEADNSPFMQNWVLRR